MCSSVDRGAGNRSIREPNTQRQQDLDMDNPSLIGARNPRYRQQLFILCRPKPNFSDNLAAEFPLLLFKKSRWGLRLQVGLFER